MLAALRPVTRSVMSAHESSRAPRLGGSRRFLGRRDDQLPEEGEGYETRGNSVLGRVKILAGGQGILEEGVARATVWVQ